MSQDCSDQDSVEPPPCISSGSCSYSLAPNASRWQHRRGGICWKLTFRVPQASRQCHSAGACRMEGEQKVERAGITLDRGPQTGSLYTDRLEKSSKGERSRFSRTSLGSALTPRYDFLRFRAARYASTSTGVSPVAPKITPVHKCRRSEIWLASKCTATWYWQLARIECLAWNAPTTQAQSPTS